MTPFVYSITCCDHLLVVIVEKSNYLKLNSDNFDIFINITITGKGVVSFKFVKQTTFSTFKMLKMTQTTCSHFQTLCYP